MSNHAAFSDNRIFRCPVCDDIHILNDAYVGITDERLSKILHTRVDDPSETVVLFESFEEFCDWTTEGLEHLDDET